MFRKKQAFALTAIILSVMTVVSGCGGAPAGTDTAPAGTKEGSLKITNVSYDPTRELYQAYNEAFVKYYEEQTERTENFETTGPEKEDKSIDPTLIFGLAMVGGIVCITGAGILAGVAIKKRNEEDD